MAEGLLFNTIEKLIGKLGSMAVETWNMRDDLEKLVENMSEIKAVVLDAEEQQSNSHQVQLWLEKLKDALDDADDLLDDFNTEELRRQVMTSDKKAKKFRIFFSSSNQIFYSFKMAGKIKELGKIIQDLNVGKRTFNFTNRTPERRVLKQRETHSFVREEEVIGREEEKKELLELLFDNSINVKDNVSVISIIGVGGLGKTTLAQHVYNDKQVQQHFELKKWVCVSDDFDVKGIAAKIIGSKTNIVEMDKVQLELREKVEGKRYLLVLDDIWNEDGDLWLQLMTLLKDGAKGSKIIITTRSEMVAKVCRSSSIFFLKGLDEKQSWRLFSQLAFENEKDLENENLVSIGKEIVKKCSGVPLAIRIIGCLMLTMEDWSTFKNKDLVKIDEQGGHKIFQLIKLSYDHLPFHLKNCFAFCSLFPQDFEIEKQMLIRLWIAQGFVQSSDENISLEDIGEKYFMDFVHKSFFQNITKRFDGKVHFQMHDIVHDLASVISRSEYLLVKERGQHVDKKNRHVSFGFKLDSSWKVPTSLLNAYKLRTFLLPLHTIYYYESSMEMSAHACISILSSFSRFRVLHLNCTVSMKIPSCIGRMKHLRYLDLTFSIKVEELPRSITELINLETLLLNYCESLRELPKDLWKLVSLRHLELNGCSSLTYMPRGIGKMTNLQTLTLFVLDATSKDSARASELRGLNNLRGELKITGLQCLRHCPTEAKDINLMGKPHLHRLSLNWNYEEIVGDVNDLDKDDIILHDIVMHSNITSLKIRGFGGVTMSSLVNLSTSLDKLTVEGCTRLQYLEIAPLHVKCIWLWDLPSLEWIVNNNNNNGDNSSTFCASLAEIGLEDLPNLKGWCRCSEEEMSKGCCHQFKSLDHLLIDDCRNLISIPQHTDIKVIDLGDVTSKILQQAVTHSKVEFLKLNNILNFKSLRGVFQHLTSVCDMHISNCEEFDPCNDEDGCYSMKWKELTNLKVLTFDKLPKMKYLPEGLQHITTLQTLRIIDCVNLTSIPEWATSLQVYIRGCPMVTPLPTAVEDQ
ncbi:disease resistance protein RGA2-like isoform X1 [Trifolium pratense]|uniref:disease resistance protein RGA2-like isoform X1 n=1 Tax=Trifolium pratense TaxID=57577 RepID=UPI0008444634|nr:disease resistance protein RGA2-like isoform X1 [Trifolium pratense]XP_045830470.1 disease resistance protein RGA2-like isoform X1 [Trifolium pratense]